ncbi:autotransporter domain-containing protein [Bradyrhizobium sp. Arg68]|uniref:autotransporter domain-containing protein n=1 Tax=Bradyrhizobium ivorense TaxID=2511166 RepID=UPI001E46425A|nr:autotransporter domain-containing protein [Bradyrhizobium ivorense]MCC8936317.1 autotransporter domain-containing protein [Bradyrhizobium ivorense]
MLRKAILVLVVTTASSGAYAQCVPSSVTGNQDVGRFLAGVQSTAGQAAGAFSGAIGNVNTAFLTQQGSAFVSAPADPAPNQPGGGAWVRGVGGEVTFKNTSNSSSSFTAPAAPAFNAAVTTPNCASSVRETFAGVQVGQDIARLNWGGWNVHVGATAGYLGSHATDNNGTTSDFEVPFLGGYLVATYGRFFADVMVRGEFYNIKVNDPGLGFYNQPLGGRGVSVSTSAGYNFALANNWFIEPSAGFIWARTSIDPFNFGGVNTIGTGGTFTANDIESEIGRLSVRVGTTATYGNVVWQPFASASVFHEFAGNVIASATNLPNGLFTVTGQASTSRVGTYGQYSLGLAGQVVNTGWLGFVRVDYRNGENIEGWTGNAGLRYQFTPEMIAAVMPTKAPVKARSAVVVGPTNWTGFYVGGFAGGAFGRTDIGFVGDPTSGNKPYTVGALGGGQIGYNYQVNNWVFGAEGDIGAANVNGARPCGTATGLVTPPFGFPTGGGFSPAYFTCQDRMDWMATAAARLGWTYERTLFFVKAGGAWAHDTVSANCILGPTATVAGFLGSAACVNQAGVVTPGFSTGGTRTGWLIGVGTEFDLGGNWSAKAEYNYISFDRNTRLASDGTTQLTDRSDVSQMKIGINYRFGAPALVAAKY